MSVTMTGYITSGTYYWSWALKNTTTGNFVPIVGRAGRYAASAKTRTVSTIQGNQSMNCVAPYVGSVHSYASQNWVTFDASNGGLAYPEIHPNSGDIVYIENRRQITRAPDQIEDIKLVIEF